MKKMMILVCAIMMAATANAKNVENVNASFGEVRINVPARVHVVAGETYDVKVVAKNDVIASSIRCTIKNGVLCINSNDLDALVNNGETLRITVVAPVDVKLSIGRDMQAINVRKDFASDKNELIAENK